MTRLHGLFFLLVAGALALSSCGGSEKKKSGDSPSQGGTATAGASGQAGSGAGGSDGSVAGAAGTTSGRGGSGGGAGEGVGGEAGETGEGGAAGEGADGGVGGESGSGPTMRASRLDVLFVVDNSISMYEKQGVLAEAVPTLVTRLIDPYCVYPDGTTVPPANATCPSGSVREIDPVRDMNFGVITTALGSHGGDVCVTDPTEMPPRPLNDHARFVGKMRPGLVSWDNWGFLKWDPDGRNEPPGESDVALFTSHLQAMIEAVGDRGCGYEAPLEAMYRFLVDPEPPLEVSSNGSVTVVTGVDTALLAEREMFLRPDSAVIVVILSDEDDCSILDEPGRQGWLTGRRAAMPRGSDACSHPEDPDVYRCCIPCVMLDSSGFTPAAGCDYTADAACSLGHTLPALEDSTNLRCFRQKERFGIDLLYPVGRYVTGLTAQTVTTRSGMTVPNPLFVGGRDPELVVLATLVGVPWQDLARDAEDFDGFELMSAAELRAADRFEVILGDFEGGVPPTDPFMLDSVEPRSGSNPITNQAIAPPTAGPTATINGHEQTVVNRDDLQYACTFPLPTPIPCTGTNMDGCDCDTSEQAYNRPLCQDPTSGAPGTTQFFAKAYPGRRQLEVGRRLGDQATIASICPRTLGDPLHPSYGYVPAMRALQEHVRRVIVSEP
jgi:hypothetical protein